MAWLVDLSERGVLEPVREQGLLAEDFDAGSRGRQAACQDEEQVSRGSADGDVGFAVAMLDGDAGRGPRDQPLAGTGQAGVGGVEVQALAISAQFPCRTGRATGDQAEPFVDAVRGKAGIQIDVPPGGELGIG
jgi:hypothetical protein